MARGSWAGGAWARGACFCIEDGLVKLSENAEAQEVAYRKRFGLRKTPEEFQPARAPKIADDDGTAIGAAAPGSGGVYAIFGAHFADLALNAASMRRGLLVCDRSARVLALGRRRDPQGKKGWREESTIGDSLLLDSWSGPAPERQGQADPSLDLCSYPTTESSPRHSKAWDQGWLGPDIILF